MEVIAANFPTDAAATAAIRDLTESLSIDADLVELEHLAPAARRHAGEPLVIAWVDPDARAIAREVMERHHGRHCPFDWAQALTEQVSAETISVVAWPQTAEVLSEP